MIKRSYALLVQDILENWPGLKSMENRNLDTISEKKIIKNELYPSYLNLIETGEFEERERELFKLLESCDICPRNCLKNRLENEKGVCMVGRYAKVASYFPHFGEEPPITGIRGSGTIFLSYCNLRCIFCQNYKISHFGEGYEIREEELAGVMMELQDRGCHNINLVTPTHVVPQLVKALKIAAHKGLRIPIVYNCGGYEGIEALKLLDGIIDIYMPDVKYSDDKVAKLLSKAPDYWKVIQEVIPEMHRQVGDLILDENGIAIRGLLVRHLVLPKGLSGTEQVVKFIAEKVSKDTYFNLMSQYYPCFRAVGHPDIGRPITEEEYREALGITQKYGLTRCQYQGHFRHFFDQ
jgi:putative pyruvate formate lyase activating enzyme